jgi:hypothetical protein
MKNSIRFEMIGNQVSRAWKSFFTGYGELRLYNGKQRLGIGTIAKLENERSLKN